MTMRRSRAIIVISVLAVPVAVFLMFFGAGLRINLTPSYALGL